MAKPTTTHVIEIESGIGEPAFIPLTMGQELQPISVGKKGMWRVEGARVLDVHAFVYFDGTSLFLQSADEQSAAMVDGYKVGKSWTELHAPCRIEIGAARLRFRSLVGDAQAATVAQVRPPVAPPPQAAPSNRPPGPPPMTFPKPERPFAPGALVAQNDDESTRIAPLESTGARPLPGMSGAIHAVAPPRPAAGRPIEEDFRAQGGPGPMPSHMPPGTGAYAAMPGQPSMPPHGMPPGAMGPGGPMGPAPSGMVQGVMPVGASGAYPQAGYPQGPYGPAPSGAMPPMGGPAGPSMAPGGYGSMTPPQGGAPPPEEKQGFSEMMKDPAQRKKLMALGVILLGGAYVLLMDDDPPAQQTKKPLRDGGADAALVATGAGSAAPDAATSAATPASPCPPGFQPYGTIQPGQPITCVPSTPQTPPSATAVAANDDASDAGAASTSTPSSSKTSGSKKTLERQAVDYVAIGEYEKAIGIYEKLAAQNPNNQVYTEALRILRMKLDGGP